MDKNWRELMESNEIEIDGAAYTRDDIGLIDQTYDVHVERNPFDKTLIGHNFATGERKVMGFTTAYLQIFTDGTEKIVSVCMFFNDENAWREAVMNVSRFAPAPPEKGAGMTNYRFPDNTKQLSIFPQTRTALPCIVLNWFDEEPAADAPGRDEGAER